MPAAAIALDAPSATERRQWELRFPALFNGRRGYAFPCDAAGCVDMDHLSETARRNYLYARAMMGRETGWPSVRDCTRHH